MHFFNEKKWGRILIILLVLGIFAFSLVSLDVEHTSTCHSVKCSFCDTIHFSQKIVAVIAVTVIFLRIMIFMAVFPYFYKNVIHCRVIPVVHTLVSQKIQMNA